MKDLFNLQSDSGVQLLLVLSSVSPIVLLWAIRGTSLTSDCVFISACLVIFFILNIAHFLFLFAARKHETIRIVRVKALIDRRPDIITYLFALVLPLYATNLDSWRNLALSLAVILIIVLLFWRTNLHYLNFWVLVFGLTCFEVRSEEAATNGQGLASYILISRRSWIPSEEQVRSLVLSDTVFLEAGRDRDDGRSKK